MRRTAHPTLRVFLASALTAFLFVVAGRRTRRGGSGVLRAVAPGPDTMTSERVVLEPQSSTDQRPDVSATVSEQATAPTEAVTDAPEPTNAHQPTNAHEPTTDSFADLPTTEWFADLPTTESFADMPTTESFADVPTTESFADVPTTESFADVMARVDRVLETASGLAASRVSVAPPPDTPIEPPPADNVAPVSVFVSPETRSREGRSSDRHLSVAEALGRAGLDEVSVTTISEQLHRGISLDVALLERFEGLPLAPPLPRRAGSLLVVVGPGVEARRLAASLACEIGIDPASIPLASRHPGAHSLVSGSLLVRSAEEAAEFAPGWRRAEPAVVAVDAAVAGTERSWATHVIAALRPTGVWGVVDSTWKTEDVDAWIRAIGGVDALALENLTATVSPADALGLGIPVARLEGQPASAARWVATIMDRIEVDEEPVTSLRDAG
jgi:hypothetical protein